jgi:hypothetical protein
MSNTRQQIHELIDQVPEADLPAIVSVLESMLDSDDEPMSDEERRAVAASREYFAKGGEGIPLEQVLAECGFTIDEIRTGSKATK